MAKYSTEFKVKVVKEYLEGKTSYKSLAKKYNIEYSHKQTWYILRRKLGLNYKKNKLVA